MKSSLIQTIAKYVICATFFVPLIVLPQDYIFPFIVPKIIWLRSLTLVLLAAYIMLLIADWQKYRPRVSVVSIVVALFWLSFTISTFAGVDWYHSFWDNHERMLGLFTVSHYVLLYFISTAIIREWREWQMLLRIFLFAGSIVMVIGVMQRFNPELLLNRGASRVSATLGNAIYYGGYGLFLSFTGALSVLREKTPFWRWYAAGCGLLGFIGVFLSGTRGSFLGLVAGIIMVCLGYMLGAGATHPKLRRGLGIGLIALVCIGGILFALKRTAFVQSIPIVGNVMNISLSAGSIGTRLMAWQIAIQAWQERPLFGWGPNNFYYAFNQFYRPQFLEYGWGETWFDNSHNILFNTLAVQGAFGLLVYLALFGATLIAIIYTYRKGQLDLPVAVFGAGFLVAHFVHNFFVFADPTSLLYFFIWLAFLNRQLLVAGSVVTGETVGASSRHLPYGWAVIVTVPMLLLIYATDINAGRANQAALGSIRSLYGHGNPVATYAAAIAIPTPHIDDIRNDFSRTIIEVLPQYIEQKRLAEAKELFDLARTELAKNRVLHPRDIRVHIQQAELAGLASQSFHDPSYLQESVVTLQDALRLSPKRQQIQYMLASVHMALNTPAMAEAVLQESINNDPKIAEGWWRLAQLYDGVGKKDTAKATAQKAAAAGVVFTGNGEKYMKSLLGT